MSTEADAPAPALTAGTGADDGADGTRRRGPGLSTAGFVGGLVAIVVAGALLLVGLGMAFGRADGSQVDTTRVATGFDGPTLDGRLEVAAGAFSVVDGALVADAVPARGPAAVIARRSAVDGRVEVRATEPVAGWGVVVRWEGPEDHWLVRVPHRGPGLEVVRVAAGEEAVVGRAPAALAPGAVVDVRYDDRRIDVRVDDVLVTHVRDTAVAGRGAGVATGSTGARWDDLVVGPRPRPVVRPDG